MIVNESLREKLEAHGWFSERRGFIPRDLPRKFEFFDVARSILDKFGGLCIGNGATNEVVIDFNQIEYTDEVAEEIHECSRALKRKLFPIGVLPHGGFDLLVSSEGELYFFTGYELVYVAASFLEGLEKLLSV